MPSDRATGRGGFLLATVPLYTAPCSCLPLPTSAGSTVPIYVRYVSESGNPAVDPTLPVYVYVQVADGIAAQIASGRLQPGAMLPGERALAEEFGVALGTVRRAVQELRERGAVVTLPSKGTYIADRAAPES